MTRLLNLFVLCLLFALALTLIGCQGAHIDSVGLNNANGDVKGAGAYANAAVKAISAAEVGASAKMKGQLDLALSDISDLEGELSATSDALGTIQKQLNEQGQQLKEQTSRATKDESTIKTLNTQFFSPRQIAIWHWALIIVFASSAAIAALYLFAGASPAGPLKLIATVIGRIWALFVPLFGNLLTMLHMRQVATAKTAQAATTAGSIAILQ